MTRILRSASLLALLLPAKMVAGQDNPVPYLTREGKYQYVDASTMQPVFDARFDGAQPFSNGLALVRTGQRQQFILPNGRPAIKATFNEGYSFRGNRAVVYKNSRTYLIDDRGHVIPPNENIQEWTIAEGRAVVVTSAGKSGYIDVATGLQKIKPMYEAARAYSEGLAAIRLNNKWGFIDMAGNNVVPAIFDDVTQYGDGLAGVRIGPRWGVIDAQGRMVIQPRYDRITPFVNGHAFVQLNQGFWGVINRQGTPNNKVIKAQSVSQLSDGLASYMVDNQWGFVDINGDVVIPARYTRASSFQNGIAWVIRGNKGFYIDRNGREFREQ